MQVIVDDTYKVELIDDKSLYIAYKKHEDKWRYFGFLKKEKDSDYLFYKDSEGGLGYIETTNT